MGPHDAGAATDLLLGGNVRMKPEIWRWSGADTARAVATREISSREAVQSSLDRIAQVNPALNAVVEVL